MKKIVPILAVIAAVLAFVFLVRSPPEPEPTPTETATPQAVETSPRPRLRECAGTVTNNPAILEWRRLNGC